MSGTRPSSIQEAQALNIRQAAELFAFWVSTTPEDKLHWIPGEPGVTKARPAMEYINECARLNRRFAVLLGGDVSIDVSKATNAQEAQDVLLTSASQLTTVVRALTDDQLHVEYQLPMGPMTALDVIQFAARHMDYHGGQLNAYQCMYGDDEFRVPGED